MEESKKQSPITEKQPDTFIVPLVRVLLNRSRRKNHKKIAIAAGLGTQYWKGAEISKFKIDTSMTYKSRVAFSSAEALEADESAGTRTK